MSVFHNIKNDSMLPTQFSFTVFRNLVLQNRVLCLHLRLTTHIINIKYIKNKVLEWVEVRVRFELAALREILIGKIHVWIAELQDLVKESGTKVLRDFGIRSTKFPGG